MTIREIMPDIEPYWIEIYGNVAVTGEPRNFERYNAPLASTSRVHAYCPKPGQFACLFRIRPRGNEPRGPQSHPRREERAASRDPPSGQEQPSNRDEPHQLQMDQPKPGTTTKPS
jgi:hypothetical protein